MSKFADWIIAVDFGTAYSKMAIAPLHENEATRLQHAVPLAIGGTGALRSSLLLESAVFVGAERVTFGAPALALAGEAEPGRKALQSFKMLLSAPDIDTSLDLKTPAAVDPHRVFTQRKLITLYLAYLVRRARKALQAEPLAPSDFDPFRWRYTHVPWKGRAGSASKITAELLGQALALEPRIGDEIDTAAGLPISEALALTDLASPADPQPMQGKPVVEALGAAACHVFGGRMQRRVLVVIDVGAGTTDIGAIAVADGRVAEVQSARRSLDLGGDIVDLALLNVIVDTCFKSGGTAAKSRAWNELLPNIRDVKEALFRDGVAPVEIDGGALTVTLNQLERRAEFRSLSANIRDAYAESLNAVGRDMRSARDMQFSVVLAGGGSALPTVRAFVSKLRPAGRGTAITVEPVVPHWAHESRFMGALSDAFPQVSVAMGACLLPEDMVDAAAQSGVN